MMQLLRSVLGAGLTLCLCLNFVKGDATSDLVALQDAFFKWHMEQAPEFSTGVGIKAYNDRLKNYSLEVFDVKSDAVQGFINNASTIDRSQLDRQHQYSYDIFMDTLTTFVSNYGWRQYGGLNPINFMESFYLDLDYIIDTTPFDTKGDFENFISRLEARPTQIDQMIRRMEESITLGTTYHNVSVRAVPGQIGALVSQDPQDTALYRPFNHTLDTLTAISQGDKDDMRSRAQTALQNLWTALRRLKTFFENTYSRHTRGTYGVGGLPEGGNYYRACLKWHLSVDTPPTEVHQIGLREVARISQNMHAVMTKHGFSGTIREFYQQLNEDPQFHKATANDLLDLFRDLIFQRITPKLPQLFKDIPPSKIVIKPLPYDGPYGMYSQGSEDGSRPGTFYVNLMRPNETSTFTMAAMTLHESVPGHHLQAIFQLAAHLPNFQKYTEYEYSAVPYLFPFYTAYTEGWGLYSEYLGEEMGVYKDDYELMGRYGYEIFRACRLVVDTGVHYFGWSRERAIQYVMEHTFMERPEVEIEIDRYITWPGQACAYKIGELKIKELRQKAATTLGSKFDVHDFHSLLLTNGPVPLRVMETIVADYIADRSPGGQIIG